MSLRLGLRRFSRAAGRSDSSDAVRFWVLATLLIASTAVLILSMNLAAMVSRPHEIHANVWVHESEWEAAENSPTWFSVKRTPVAVSEMRATRDGDHLLLQTGIVEDPLSDHTSVMVSRFRLAFARSDGWMVFVNPDTEPGSIFRRPYARRWLRTLRDGMGTVERTSRSTMRATTAR